MKKIISFSICFALFYTQVLANELLVVSRKNSKQSQKWQEEVSKGYPKSEIGSATPVKIVEVDDAGRLPEWVVKAVKEGRIDEIVGVPTFIIWDELGKKELGRLTGYTQKSIFYSQLSKAFSQISQGLRPDLREVREGSGGSHQDEGSGSKQQKEGSGGMSQDVRDHIYKTPEEAKRASKMLGLGGEIHSHETPQGIIYMPGPTM